MSATNGTAVPTVLDRVREVVNKARRAGEEPPGRPTLVKLTHATDHQVRVALEKLKAEPGPVGADLVTAGDEVAAVGERLANPGEPAPPAEAQPVEPARRARRPWPLFLIGLAAAVSVWSGWVGLGQMAGFGVIQPLPGVLDFHLNTAIVLPISVEAYAAYALQVWLSSSNSAATIRFAKWSAITSLVVGGGAQVAYHLMTAAGFTRAPWQVVTLVAIVPVVVLGLASALAKLVANDARAAAADDPTPPTPLPGHEG